MVSFSSKCFWIDAGTSHVGLFDTYVRVPVGANCVDVPVLHAICRSYGLIASCFGTVTDLLLFYISSCSFQYIKVVKSSNPLILEILGVLLHIKL